MCMLAAVTNTPNASRRLSDMLLQQEAFFGAFYSGICTVSDDSFHLKKCVGCHSDLINQASPLNLPGLSGIAHSRTKGGGGSRRAQPFVDHSGMLVGMGTGTHGIFCLPEHALARQRLVDEMFDAGVQFNSTESSLSGSAKLPDGSSVHNSEMVVQAVAHYIRGGLAPFIAIKQVFERVPAEGAYVFLLRDQPENLYIANFNMRLVYAASPSAMQLASSPWALKACGQISEVPPNRLLCLNGTHVQSEELLDSSSLALSTDVPDSIETAFFDYVRAHPGNTWAVIVEKAIVPLFPSKTASLLVPASFHAAERLVDSGALSLAVTKVPGAEDETTVPQLVFEAAS